MRERGVVTVRGPNEGHSGLKLKRGTKKKPKKRNKTVGDGPVTIQRVTEKKRSSKKQPTVPMFVRV